MKGFQGTLHRASTLAIGLLLAFSLSGCGVGLPISPLLLLLEEDGEEKMVPQEEVAAHEVETPALLHFRIETSSEEIEPNSHG